MNRVQTLNEAIATYEALISNYTRTREVMLIRRRSAADHVMVELDERLAANARTIDALRLAVAMTREQIKLIEVGKV